MLLFTVQHLPDLFQRPAHIVIVHGLQNITRRAHGNGLFGILEILIPADKNYLQLRVQLKGSARKLHP
ncbi:hypothetical protein D3C73_1001420 [compost metagenome]